ncbi:MAG: PAM68 family protein [Leptolyngbyaceae cyanobacterium bins.59]|nr:PAM68 family protein [Leptolyngbyaceae cyanobacterium bins.59]
MASKNPPESRKTDQERSRLPFEPTSSKKSSDGEKAEKQVPVSKAVAETSKAEKSQKNREDTSIPQAVSKRMARRMALFSGIPSTLGVSVFFISYWVVSHGWYKLPTGAVLLLSMGFFGLGVLGLSYGVLSASWDEDVVGDWLGWSEFKTNLGRMTAAWRSAKRKE